MKKNLLLKITVFVIIFTIIASFLSDLFIFKSREKLIESKEQLIALPKDSIDVLFLGASGIYAGVSPINLWNEYGITSFGLTSSNQPPIITYYTFLETLKHQKPELVVIDFVSLTNDNSPERFEAYYQRGLTGIKNVRIKWQAIWTIDNEFDIPSKMTYLSPFYRYHHRWNELEKNDFKDINPYKSYTLGGFMNDRVVPVKFSKEFMDKNSGKMETNKISEKYYHKIMDIANENGITVLALSPPRVGTNYGKHLAIKDFCNINQIDYIDYNVKKYLEELDLDLEKDFYDTNHLNRYGNLKLTTHIGQYITDHFSFEDKRDNIEFKYWNDLYEDYLEGDAN